MCNMFIFIEIDSKETMLGSKYAYRPIVYCTDDPGRT